MSALRLLVLPVVLVLCGCASLGSRKVAVDRVDYTVSLRDSEKTQLLSNIVGLSRGDAPLFLSVTSVISQYTRERSGRIDLGLDTPPGDALGGVGASVLLRETPTVTYTPMTGERFARNMLSPVPPASLLAMMEAGWSSDQLFRVGVRSINGVDNGSRAPLFEHPPDPRFDEAVKAFRRLQRSGAISVRIRQEDKTFSAVANIAPRLTDQDRADLEILRRTLGMGMGGGRELAIVFAGQPATDHEIALVTRSMFEILGEMAQCVEGEETPIPDGCLIRVRGGAAAPADAYVAVLSKGRWYWVDGADDASKQVFLLVQMMISLSDDSGAAHGPLVAIPAGG